jgi:hypothetical protein
MKLIVLDFFTSMKWTDHSENFIKSINDKTHSNIAWGFTLRWTTLYICWECPSRSYLARYTIILVTSRDCNHITWFRNSAFVSLLATLSHRTWIANDFSSFQLLQKRSNSDCIFWKFSYKRKFFFLTHLLYAKSTFNSDRRLYKKRWCDLMRTWSFNFYWNRI